MARATKSVKKSAAKPIAKIAVKAPAKATSKKPIAKAAAGKAKPAAMASVKAAMPHSGATCPCPCHEPIEASRYGRMFCCHIMCLATQSRTWGVWLIAFAMLMTVGSLLMSLPEAPRPLLFHVANHGLTALAFALVFRLAFTGCGGILEGTKLGLLLFTPLASLTVFLTLASIPAFMPLAGTGVVGAVLAAGALYLLIGALIGALCGWYLKPAGMCCRA